MIVLDASAAIEWLLRTPRGGKVAHRILARQETLHAPHLLTLEIAQVLRRYVITGAVTTARAQESLRDLLDMRLTCYPHDPLLWRIWELRDNLTAYDAAYVALAEALAAPVLTCDRRLAAASGHRARIELV
jgi:predicted nucleic acid-binding protein